MNLNKLLTRGNGISDLLIEAGMDPAHVRRDRNFWGQWGWTDGAAVFVTVWLDEVQDPHGVPKWSMSEPKYRDELTGLRRARAQGLWDMLASRNGHAVRVVLQTKKADRTKWKSGITEQRGLDPEPWYEAREGSAILLQRGALPGRRDVSVDSKPMLSREPSWSVRETRPEQARFRQRVGDKTGRRCALTGAPMELCDAAHFAWTNWRSDNDAHHGLLLRRDLHIALDINWMAIDHMGRVEVSEFLASCSPEYAALHGRTVQTGRPIFEEDAKTSAAAFDKGEM